MILLREEAVDDYRSIRELTVSAFRCSSLGYHGEAELIDAIRNETTDRLSLVACYGDRIVGHVLFSPVHIRTSTEDVLGMGLGPISVAPLYQRKGMGGLLVKEGLARLAAQDCSFVVVMGHPDYYPRFGFTPALQFGITHGFDGIPQNVFFVQAVSVVSLMKVANGRAFYSNAFGPQHGGT